MPEVVATRRHSKIRWSELSCEGKQLMNWIAWILIYLLTINPIINPLITSLIYAPYRMTIKKFLVNIPVGNRPFYNYQGEQLHLDSSFTSVRRSRNRRSSSTESASLRQSTELFRIVDVAETNQYGKGAESWTGRDRAVFVRRVMDEK
ncbi:hypothetical protein TELCIR_08754 [Teladorsagia circumcincta]|uniref:Uncharacterized protein n=1 Tax=Teladorsagia circumcincta TaxID=45464 RepID=A0A2G9UGP2_TELCI|nr:hypothetical protein TELCIR_08754 [Teladorsagia circumcincta]